MEAGFPEGVVNILPGYGPTAGAAIARHMDVDKVAFTGSTEVGHLIMEAAAETNLKRVTLELGGKSPNIVFADADMDAGGRRLALRAVLQSGPVLLRRIARSSSKKKSTTSLWNAARHAPRSARWAIRSIPRPNRVRRSTMSSSTRSWATSNPASRKAPSCCAAASASGERGYFIEPTVFADVKDNMKIAQEEIFGPVMSIIKFKDMDEVVERANNTMYGLAAAVWTRDIGKAHAIANSVRAGTVWVNCYDVFDAAAPFGGFKQSGIGRELGEYGLQQYTEVKTVTVKL